MKKLLILSLLVLAGCSSGSSGAYATKFTSNNGEECIVIQQENYAHISPGIYCKADIR